mmetsp:Transcript_126085/g.315073  ORF Transcript_126085/g.315073 Transcript_126085/m.315073 type:complete len:122 (+) Transcript_126085:220-585(+)
MAEDLQLKLIFVYEEHLQDLDINSSTTVKELKRIVKEQHWPANSVIDAEKLDRVRLFAGGRELGKTPADDSKSVNDAKIVVPGQEGCRAPVHVMGVIKKDGEATSERDVTEKSQGCVCVLL